MSTSSAPLATLACGGAPATVKPGIPPTAALAGTAITAVLSAFGAAEAGLIFDVILAGVNWDLTNICTSGDPGDVTLTQQDYQNALLVGSGSLQVAAVYKFHQWMAHAMFSQWCNCADGTSPPTPTVTAPPPYVPNPGAPSGVPTPPCWNVDQFYPPQTAVGGVDISNSWLPNTQRVPISPAITSGPTTAPLIPAGVTNIHTDVTLTETTGIDALGVQIQLHDINGAFLQYLVVYDNALQLGLRQVHDFPMPANAHSWWVVYECHNAPQDSVQAIIQLNCTGTSTPSLNTPCCPPDPSVDIRLRSIQDMLQFLMDQTRPSYKPGTVHPGLTGAGTIAIADVVGVKVQITAGVPSSSQKPGTPPYEWSVGWMSVSEPGGMLDEKRITRQSQLWLSGVAPYATVFGYYLNPGFTITMTELVPA